RQLQIVINFTVEDESKAAGRRETRLIRQLISVNDSEAGKAKMHRQPLSSPELLRIWSTATQLLQSQQQFAFHNIWPTPLTSTIPMNPHIFIPGCHVPSS